jgi:YD repeat-containing protein
MKTGDIVRNLLIPVSVIALMIPSGINATETVTYSYDAQGRLVQSVISGTVNNGQTSSTTFDAANNRTNYSVSLSGATPPPPPPPPSNQPPVTVADSLSVPKCAIRSKDVIFNDSDPEGNVPLSLVSAVNSNASLGSAYVASASNVQYEAYASAGSDTVTYTVQDSLGATSTGTLTVSVSGGTCSAQQSTTPPSAGGGS